MPIRVLLADDHPIVLSGLDQLFRNEPDFEVLARCSDGEEAVREIERLAPDVAVLDVKMPKRTGVEVLRDLKERGLSTRVVLLTAELEDQEFVEAVRLGVKGLVLKEMASRLLVQCVRTVHGGGQWLDRETLQRALDNMVQRESALKEVSGLLTPRELEIVKMVSQGLRNKEIGARLFITEGTVKIHLHSIYEKVKVNGRMELSLYAREKGLV